MNKKIALYPGTFDPITFGHIDIIRRASILFDEVIVAVARNPQKKPLFNCNERKDMITHCTQDIPNTRVDMISGLLVDYALSKNVNTIIRGLRAVSDFEYELQMAMVNRKLQENIVTVFMIPHENFSYLNSSIVKELAMFKGDIDSFVPQYVKTKLMEKLLKNESTG